LGEPPEPGKFPRNPGLKTLFLGAFHKTKPSCGEEKKRVWPLNTIPGKKRDPLEKHSPKLLAKPKAPKKKSPFLEFPNGKPPFCEPPVRNLTPTVFHTKEWPLPFLKKLPSKPFFKGIENLEKNLLKRNPKKLKTKETFPLGTFLGTQIQCPLRTLPVYQTPKGQLPQFSFPISHGPKFGYLTPSKIQSNGMESRQFLG